MRGSGSGELLEEELTRVLRETIRRFARDAEALVRLACWLEQASSAKSAVELGEEEAAVRVGAAHGASLVLTLQLRLEAMESIAASLSMLRSAPAEGERTGAAG